MKRAAVAASCLLLVTTGLRGDVHPNVAGGFPVDQSFHVGDVDNVNLFNGSLTLTFPIGPSYPVDGGFGYGLKLVYNSSPWIFKTVNRTGPGLPDPNFKTQSWPSPCSNAGLGWRVSLGRMDPPCQVPDVNDNLLGPIYQDETGTDHVFYPILHGNDPEDAPVADVQDVLYTRDGSYLRLLVRTNGTREVDFPDGSVRKFDSTGMATEIRDAFGNGLQIAYPTSNDRWVLSDDQGRTQTIFFRSDFSESPQTVDHIDLTAFGGTATYTFEYAPVSLYRSCPHTDAVLSQQVPVPLLTGVVLPDGSKLQIAAGYVTGTPASGLCVDNSGAIRALTLPTLGRLAWTWQPYKFPSGSTGKARLQRNYGVATRTQTDPVTGISGTWTYTQSPSAPTAATQEMSTAVRDPLGHRTVSYFSVAVAPSFTGWSLYDYSLPFTRNAAFGGLNLSRQTYENDSPASLSRSEYVLYERDPMLAADMPNVFNTNRRVVRSRTVYDDDGGTWSGMVNSQFDGLGHYRRQDTEGTFPGSNLRSHHDDYNPARGTYTVNAAANTGSGYSVWPAGTKWALETMTYTWDAENGATVWTDLCYAPGTTTLTRRRVHRQDGATQSASDLLTVWNLETIPPQNIRYTGNVTSEAFYGGDVPGGLATGVADLCAMALPASPTYQINHTYVGGVRATSKYAGTGFYVLDQTIDVPTGLIVSSRDTAGLQTDFLYDLMGRRTWYKPEAGQGGWVEFAYTKASSATNQPANVIVRQRDNGSESAPVLAVSQVEFDGFGRVRREFRNLPDGNVSKRETTYDGAGNKWKVSEVMTGNPTNVTTFTGYDAFGRATSIQPPDGAGHSVSLTYHGARQVDRTVSIGTSTVNETPSTTTEVYDRFGRLLSVTEPSGSGGTQVTTAYGYDVGNRLTSVSTTAGATTQNRAFAYDRAGLMQSETHPEKGAGGNGTVTYARYDARGHAGRKTDGPNDLAFTYDAAERLVSVQEFGTNLPLKGFVYAPSNGANDRRQGKLWQAVRYNYTDLGVNPQVTETYVYGGRDGRVSRRDTSISTGESFTQSFTYNALGLASAVTYPTCTNAGCTTPTAPVFSDVPAGSSGRLEVEGLYKAGVTGGCGTNPLRYCPGDPVTRAQMAVFLLGSKEGTGYAPPPCTTPTFADVPCSSPFAPWIEELYRRGITGGCLTNPLRFCPSDSVSNAQMAVFLLATREGTGYAAPACTAAPYGDVPCGLWYSPWVVELARRQIPPGCGGGNYCPDAAVMRSSMAVLLTRTFDLPLQLDPNTSRTVQLAYTQGLLTGVSAGSTNYGTITYHPNLMVNQVTHGNGVVETQGNDPSSMRRPSSESAAGPYASWSSGAYAYDGAGNVTRIGTASFLYDKVSRLTSGTVYDGPTGGGTPKQQSYTFDAFGNLTAINGTTGRSIPTNPATNRLNGAGTAYDAAGNLTTWNGAVYQYDRFNQMVRMTSGSESWAYLYTADDERLWSYDAARNQSHWTVRDLGGKVLRDYLNDAGRWSLSTDYVYRDGQLLAAETQTGQRHFHLDHLGTPRLITRASGYPAAYHVYYPFGEEATAFNQDRERMKFTGHERDLASPAGAGDDLDYMHARHESPVLGKAMSMDPAGASANPRLPQSWNRYSYVRNNPLIFTDPDGRILTFSGTKSQFRRIEAMVNSRLQGLRLVINNRSGRASLVPTAIQGPPTSSQSGLAGVLSQAINRAENVNLKLVSDSFDIAGGSYLDGAIDVSDLEAAGEGDAFNSASMLAHEIAEQTTKQANNMLDKEADLRIAHASGIAAEEKVTGFRRGDPDPIATTFSSDSNSGAYVIPFTRGNDNVTVILVWSWGRLVRIVRN